MPNIPLVGGNSRIFESFFVFTEQLLNGLGFTLVSLLGRSSMAINMSELLNCYWGLFQDILHSFQGLLPSWQYFCKVKPIRFGIIKKTYFCSCSPRFLRKFSRCVREQTLDSQVLILHFPPPKQSRIDPDQRVYWLKKESCISFAPWPAFLCRNISKSHLNNPQCLQLSCSQPLPVESA